MGKQDLTRSGKSLFAVWRPLADLFQIRFRAATGVDWMIVRADLRCDPNTQRQRDLKLTVSPDSLDGYVIDVGCIRKNARDELLEKARTHSRECALMGHCVESGYGIVTEDDRLTVLDPQATPKVVDVVEESETQEGIRLRVQREEGEDETMETTTVEEYDQA